MFCVLSSSIGLAVTRTPIVVPTQWSFVGLLVLVGVFGLFAQTLMTMGFQREAVGRASMGVYTGIVYGLGLGWVVFGSVPGALSLLGTMLILGSAVYVVFVKGSSTEAPVDAEAEVGLLEVEQK